MGRFVYSLFQMHVQGRVKHSVRQCLSEQDCSQLSVVCSAAASDLSSGFNRFPCLQSIYDAVREGHPVISQMNIIVNLYSHLDYHCDFQVSRDVDFASVPLTLIVVLKTNKKKATIRIMDKYKNGINKGIESVKLGEGDGLLMKGNLIHALDDTSLYLRVLFGTECFPVVGVLVPNTPNDSDSDTSSDQ